MVKMRVEVYNPKIDGPVWDYTYVHTRLSWSGDHGFFILNGRRFEIQDNEIQHKGRKVGEVRDLGKTIFIGPDDAPTRSEYRKGVIIP